LNVALQWLNAHLDLYTAAARGSGDDERAKTAELIDAVQSLLATMSPSAAARSVQHGDHAADLPSELVVRAIAVAADKFISGSVGGELETHYRALAEARGEGWDGTVRLQRGDPVPVARRPDESLTAASIGLPARVRGSRTDHVTLYEPRGIDVVLDFRAVSQLLPQVPTVVMANPADSADHPGSQRVASGDAAPAPINPDVVLERATRVLTEHCRAVDADVLIFAEYTLRPQDQEALIQTWASGDSRPMVLVPGSGTDSGRGDVPYENTSAVRIDTGGGAKPLPVGALISKATPVERSTEGVLVAREPLIPVDQTLHLFVFGDGSKLAVLLCRDAVTDEARMVLTELEVEHVLVPLMTPWVAPFDGVASGHAFWARGGFYGVNTGSKFGAIVAHPRLLPADDRQPVPIGPGRAAYVRNTEAVNLRTPHPFVAVSSVGAGTRPQLTVDALS
jgi:hypothetical protein